MGVRRNESLIFFAFMSQCRNTGIIKKLKNHSISSPLLKFHTQFIFSSCVMKKSLKTIFRLHLKNASKDFKLAGEKSGGKFGQNYRYGFVF